jgi:hypothetical protein
MAATALFAEVGISIWKNRRFPAKLNSCGTKFINAKWSPRYEGSTLIIVSLAEHKNRPFAE